MDIDAQAVEVTKLSLLLKVLEGEDEQSIGRQMVLFQERVLPDLARNIKCGNSLHTQMETLVTQMLTLNQKLATARDPQARNLLQRQIDATDRQIDRLVYNLYDLTDEEISIVEAASGL